MRFGPWLPLDRAAELAPARPGLLQARGDALLPLPAGKSAMVLYAASDEDQGLDQLVRDRAAPALRRAAELGACWIRFGETGQPARELARLLGDFKERFGAPPPANRDEPGA